MKKQALNSVIVIIFLCICSCMQPVDDALSERVKIALRDVGHELLLSDNDSTSLVLPIIELSPSRYELSFQKPLSFEPSALVSKVENSFKNGFPENYRVEVLQCSDGEVAYSYEINALEEKTIVPCGGRYLPDACYTIRITFIDIGEPLFNKKTVFYLLVFGELILLALLFYKGKQKESSDSETEYAKLGSFQFYPNQNKLVKQAEEIKLSVKECELLAIFISKPNEVIKRDELTKRVWEDHGVIVGRSLDTYISKLRKILKDDTSIKLTNVHGVGYKLEITAD